MNMNENLNKMFGKIAPGMCRLSMNGGIAVKTNNGYKTYNIKTKRLTNCNNFVFNIGEDYFFVIPTNKVNKGDIILVNDKPRCIVDVENDQITVINYEDSTIENILPERHVFMGNTYFYGKVVSMFGDSFGKGKKGTNKVMQYIMLSEMMKGTNNGNMSSMLPLMIMSNIGGDFSNMFGDLFDLKNEEGIESEDKE